jgi:hypothetical protein
MLNPENIIFDMTHKSILFQILMPKPAYPIFDMTHKTVLSGGKKQLLQSGLNVREIVVSGVVTMVKKHRADQRML